MEQQAVSFNPADAVAGGSLIDDTEATLVSLRSCMFDYNGKAPQAVPALHAVWQYLVDGHPQVAHEYYSAGDAKNLAPSGDGRQLIPVGSQGGLNDNCNAYKLMVSFINGGFPATSIGRDLGVFDGARCYVKRVPQPKVQGAQKDSKPLLVQKYLGQGQILPMPTATVGGAMVGGAVGAGVPPMGQGMPAGYAPQTPQQAPAMGYANPMPTPAPMAGLPGQPMGIPTGVPVAAPVANPMHDKAVGALMSLLMSKGGTLPKAQIPAMAFTALGNDPDRNTLVQMMFADGFLSTPGVPWKFDGQTVSLG